MGLKVTGLEDLIAVLGDLLQDKVGANKATSACHYNLFHYIVLSTLDLCCSN